MKEHPILFSTPMVEAILDGRKTMTRRLIDPQPEAGRYPQSELDGFYWKNKFYLPKYERKDISLVDNSKFGQPGDLLWVREAWCYPGLFDGFENDFYYKAGFSDCDIKDRNASQNWKPSIHMPKAAARIWLQVEEIRVERLQDISEEDAVAEGMVSISMSHAEVMELCPNLYSAKFRGLWVSINGEESWNANPWVWVVKYKVLSTTGRPKP